MIARPSNLSGGAAPVDWSTIGTTVKRGFLPAPPPQREPTHAPRAWWPWLVGGVVLAGAVGAAVAALAGGGSNKVAASTAAAKHAPTGASTATTNHAPASASTTATTAAPSGASSVTTSSTPPLDGLPASLAPAGMKQQPDSGPKTVNEMYPAPAAKVLAPYYVGGYEAHFALPTPTNGQVFVSESKFSTPLWAEHGEAYSLLAEKVVDKATPVGQPEFGSTGYYLTASGNGHVLYSYSWVAGSTFVHVVVQGVPTDVFAPMAHELAARMFARVGGATPGAAVPATGGTGQRQIFWGDTLKVLGAQPGPGCQASEEYRVTITDGARFSGQPATVALFGPDFPGSPRRTFAVGGDGSFTVPVQTHVCGTGFVEGVALLSVGGDTNVNPRPPDVSRGQVHAGG